MHGRTLVEMAVVRICHLGELDELGSLVAELGRQQPMAQAAPPSTRPVVTAKKNDESRLAAALAEAVAGRGAGPTIEPVTPTAADGAEWRVDPPHPTEIESSGANASVPASAEESVLAQWQRALTNGAQQLAPPPRPSRRDQLNEIAERPFVRQAMELFDVPDGQMRFTPPGGDAS
jgi:hypothetical protein